MEAGAEVNDAIIMENVHIGKDSRVERCILDKRALVGEGCRVGGEAGGAPNADRPDVLSTGITLVGKDARLPARWTVGRNIRWGVRRKEADLSGFDAKTVPDGASLLD